MKVPSIPLEKNSCLCKDSMVKQASLLLDSLQGNLARYVSCPARAAVLTTVMQVSEDVGKS